MYVKMIATGDHHVGKLSETQNENYCMFSCIQNIYVYTTKKIKVTGMKKDTNTGGGEEPRENNGGELI